MRSQLIAQLCGKNKAAIADYRVTEQLRLRTTIYSNACYDFERLKRQSHYYNNKVSYKPKNTLELNFQSK